MFQLWVKSRFPKFPPKKAFITSTTGLKMRVTQPSKGRTIEQRLNYGRECFQNVRQ